MITSEDIGKYCIVNGNVNDILFNNEVGKIINYNENYIGIEFLDANHSFHNLGGLGKINHCFNVPHENISHIYIYNYTFDEEFEEKFKRQNIYIRCKKEDEANKFLNFLHKKGYKWSSKLSLINENNFNINKDQTVYKLSKAFDNKYYLTVDSCLHITIYDAEIEFSDIYFPEQEVSNYDIDEEYDVVKPFNLINLWDAFDNFCEKFQNEFRDLLVEYTYGFEWKVHDKNISFTKESVPNVLWRNRKHLEEKGFIVKRKENIPLKHGMVITSTINQKSKFMIVKLYGTIYSLIYMDCNFKNLIGTSFDDSTFDVTETKTLKDLNYLYGQEFEVENK